MVAGFKAIQMEKKWKTDKLIDDLLNIEDEN